MIINFKPDTYERLKFLSENEEISIAAIVAREMERFSKEKVTVEYTLREEETVSESFKNSLAFHADWMQTTSR